MSSSPASRPLTPFGRRLVRASAVYDLIATAGFALPFTVPILFAVLGGLHHAMALPGSVPEAAAFTVLFANFTGSVVTVWSVWRLLHPSFAAAAADTVARCLFAVAMWTALAQGASPVLAVLLVLEIGWGLAQAAVLLAARLGPLDGGGLAAPRP